MTAQPPVSDTSVRNTQQSSDMVERVARAIAVLETPDAPKSATDPLDWFYWSPEDRERFRTLAAAALEASHHAELVAERDALAKRLHDLEGDVSAYRKTIDVIDEVARREAQTKTCKPLHLLVVRGTEAVCARCGKVFPGASQSKIGGDQ